MLLTVTQLVARNFLTTLFFLLFPFQMGKADTATQKFKRKSKINETQSSEEASDFQNSAASDFGPLLGTVPINMEDCEENIRTRLRKASLCSSDIVEDNLAFETPQSLKKSGLDDRLPDSRLSESSLFADSNIEIFQPSRNAQCESASKTPLVPCLSEELEELTHSEVVELCQSDALALYLCKVWTDDSLLLIVFVSNKTTSALNAVNLVFEEAEHFQVRNFVSIIFHIHLELYAFRLHLSVQYLV